MQTKNEKRKQKERKPRTRQRKKHYADQTKKKDSGLLIERARKKENGRKNT